MTIIIMAMLLAIAIGFGVFINSDLRQAKMTDDAIVAYAAAEAGLERTIFLFRKMEKSSVAELSEQDKGPVTLENRAVWDITASTDYEPVVVRQRLLNGQSLKLYFLGRVSALAANQAKSFAVTIGTLYGAPRLLTTLTQLTPQLNESGALIYHTDFSQVETVTAGSVFCYNFGDKDLSGAAKTSDYIAELKVVGQGEEVINSLTVRAYNALDCQAGTENTQAINSTVIRAEGVYNKSQQKITAYLPPRDPLSDLAGFVLFGSEEITKDY